MIQINDIIPLINNSLKGHYFKDITFYDKYCELIKQNSEDQLERPSIYEGSGNYRFIQEDTKGLICYHRVLESESEDDDEAGFGKNPLTIETYSMRVVFFGNRNAIDKDCEDINELLAKEFKTLLPRKMTLVDRNILKPGKVFIKPLELSEEEGISWSPEMVLFAIDYEFKLTSTKNCDDLSCDSEVLAACKPAIITDSDGITEVEVASGGSFTCTPATPSGWEYKRPIYTGQSTSYNINDAAANMLAGIYNYIAPPIFPATKTAQDITALVPFLTLAANNEDGNTNRMTDINGSQLYPTAYTKDNLTGLGWKTTAESGTTWVNALSRANAATDFGFSDWRVPTLQEYMTILFYEVTTGKNSPFLLDYPPFNNPLNANYWTCGTSISNTVNASNIDTDGRHTRTAKSGSLAYYLVRTHY